MRVLLDLAAAATALFCSACAKQESTFLSCALSTASGDRQTYTFEFKQHEDSLFWIDGTQELEVVRNTESQLWADHSGKFRPFAYGQTSFRLNRATGGAELFYSRKPTPQEITACQKGHNFGCESWLVLSEHTETGQCKKSERRI